MINNINLVSGASQTYIPPINPTAATEPTSGPVKQIKAIQITDTTSGPGAQSAPQEAAIPFKNSYAVSDHSFSLFKDATGTLITRYVSLRDGTITYLPEPTLVRQIQVSTGDTGSAGKLLMSV